MMRTIGLMLAAGTLLSIGWLLMLRSPDLPIAAQLPPTIAQPKEILPSQAPSEPERILPGIQPDGFLQLPNGWRLRPAGRYLELGNFPVTMALHPSGQFLAVLHAGMGEHEVVIVDLNPKKQRIHSRYSVDQTFIGLTFSPDGRHLFASGGEFEVVHQWDFERGSLSNPRPISLQGDVENLIVGGLAIDPKGRELFVAATWGDAVIRVAVDNPGNRTVIPIHPPADEEKKPKGDPPSPPDNRKDPDAKPKAAKKKIEPQAYPYTCLVEPTGRQLFVSLWSAAKVAVIDLATNRTVAFWPTAAHPTEMALSPDAKTLYVACANSPSVSVIDTTNGQNLQTIACDLYPGLPAGNTPNSLSLTPDGELLLVANADANNIAVFNVADRKQAQSLGFIPVGWYPTSVRFNPQDQRIYVANGKGVTSKPNRSGPSPSNYPINLGEYIGVLFKGSLSTIDFPKPEVLMQYTKIAYQCAPLKKDHTPDTSGVPDDNPIPKKLGDPSPIQHVIYIVKENRTYDQVFGDIKEGKGDPRLCLFPEPITPNHHRLAQEFVLLDNLYVDGEVSADGHEWTMGAYATDFVEKVWPLSYRGGAKGKIGYPSEGAMDRIARPAGGYIWDRCAQAQVSYRSYGEWINNGPKRPDGTFEDGTAAVKALEGHFDPKYRSYDLTYKDVDRAKRYIEELKRFEQLGEMPRFTVIKLPNDHTAGTRQGMPTPTAMVADNDLALGMIVEAVTHSRFWKTTAIFVIEDDTQNGPDHIDAHRSVALVISPYTKRKFVDSTMYSTSSMLRTMELILGLQPMSAYDAAARPMYNCFQAKPDYRPYKHLVPQTDLNAKNVAGAWGQDLSEQFDLTKEDRADDLLFNEVIWRSVKGANSPMPPPVRAAFFWPHVAEKSARDDHD